MEGLSDVLLTPKALESSEVLADPEPETD
ncbi:hypothetical protein A2U01_0089772, partial [Trifolium medium]|nr:hypothetical protein [Trifolium medium]